MLARALRPRGMPSCSSRITWYGPATRVTKYVERGWLCSNSQTPFSTCRPGALPITTQSWGARTWKVYGAFRSGWSKHAKIVGAASMKDMP